MRYAHVISELNRELARLDEVLEALEKIAQKQAEGPMKSKSGRTSMSSAERREVSARMKEYWRNKKTQESDARAVKTLTAW